MSVHSIRKEEASSAAQQAAVRFGSASYTILDRLSCSNRADLFIALPEGVGSLDQMLVIKRFHPHGVTLAGAWLASELDLARRVSHENVVRTIAVGLEPASCFAISEFLEGTTLAACLTSEGYAQVPWPAAAVARVLLALLDAVRHADREAPSPLGRALVRGVIRAEDVLIGYDGQVKLLGFKSAQTFGERESGVLERALCTSAAAVDALLERGRSPELLHALIGAACASGGLSLEAQGGIRQVLYRLQHEVLGSDGRRELAALMCTRMRRARARQALRLAKAYARVHGPLRREPVRWDSEQPAPASGFRRIGERSSEPAVAPWSRY
jgi:hypothetical protein